MEAKDLTVDEYFEQAECPECGKTRLDTHGGWRCDNSECEN